jgi:hypothetical protein
MMAAWWAVAALRGDGVRGQAAQHMDKVRHIAVVEQQ